MNALNLKRSAIAPVGIVAVASMNTSWKKKNARIADVVRVAGRGRTRCARCTFQSPMCSAIAERR